MPMAHLEFERTVLLDNAVLRRGKIVCSNHKACYAQKLKKRSRFEDGMWVAECDRCGRVMPMAYLEFEGMAYLEFERTVLLDNAVLRGKIVCSNHEACYAQRSRKRSG